jgi:flagellar hook-length control protein FliK
MPAQQIVRHLEPLKHFADGSYELSMQLHPAELGPVAMNVRIVDGVIHVHLQADNAGAGALLRQAAPELRAALEQHGMTAGDLDFSKNPQAGNRPTDGHTGHGRPSASGRSSETGASGHGDRSGNPGVTRRSSGGADDTLDVLL